MTRPFVDRPVVDLGAAAGAAAVAARRWALDEPVPLRTGMNALFRTGAVVLRVGHATAPPALAHELATRLIAAGLPVVPPLAGWAESVNGFAVTAWRHVEPSEAEIDWREVGRIVRRVHSLSGLVVPAGYPTPDPTGFPWWQFDELVEELTDDIDPSAVAGLRRAIEHFAPALAEVRKGRTVCHGDVHPGNVMMTDAGPLLIDWDLLCCSIPQWDHAMLLTYSSRWGGAPGVYERFASGYGDSFAGDRLAGALAELRNVAATLMRVRAGRSDPAARVEAERRLRYWRDDPEAPTWRAQ